MFEFFIRKFVKNHEQTDDPKVREQYGKLASVTGILLNLFMCAFKILVGAITGAISVLSDGINNLSDVGSSAITLFGFKLSSKKPDKKHPYGHGRIEYFAGLTVSAIIVLVAFQLCKDSVIKIINKETLQVRLSPFFITSVSVLAVCVLVKFVMGLFYRYVGKKISSVSLTATFRDCITDCISTAVVLACMISALFFKNIPVDGIGGAIVSLFIGYTGVRSVLEVASSMLGEAPDKELVNELCDYVLNYSPNVVGVHDIMFHDYGLGRRFIVLHVEIPAEGDILELHDMIDNIERDVSEKFHSITTIHLDPVLTKSERVDQLKSTVLKAVKSIDPRFEIHDFRMNEGATHTNAIFDLVLTHETKLTADEIESKLKDNLREEKNLNLVITFEHSLV